jgi:hypothetical protein
MNCKKQVLAVMTSLCLLVYIGIKVPLWLATPSMQQDETAGEILMPEVSNLEDVAEVKEDDMNIELLVKPLKTTEMEILPNPEETPEKTLQEEPIIASEAANLLDGVSDIDEQWVMRELEEHQDEIKQEDLEEGLAILDKIDANYLYDMSEGGFTEAEKADAEAFLRAELPEEDVRIVWGLIHKYMELVN